MKDKYDMNEGLVHPQDRHLLRRAETCTHPGCTTLVSVMRKSRTCSLHPTYKNHCGHPAELIEARQGQ